MQGLAYTEELTSPRRCLHVVDTMSIRAAIKQNIVVGIVAVGGGFLGSALHDPVIAKPATIRAERFEVIEPSGRLLSYWGPDADRNIPATTPKGTLLVFLDSHGVPRFQAGTNNGDYSPHLLFYGADRPADLPGRYRAQPRFSLGLGETGSPTLHMRGAEGDRVELGAVYGDVSGQRELGWALSFAAREVRAEASIGYSRWGTGNYQSGVTLTDGAGKRWEARAGDPLRPLHLMKKPR